MIKIVFDRHHASKISNTLLNKISVILFLVCSLTLLSTSAYSENDAQTYFEQAIIYANTNTNENSIKHEHITACDDDDDCTISIYPACTNSKVVPSTYLNGSWINGIFLPNIRHYESVNDPCVRSGTIIITDGFDPNNTRNASDIYDLMEVPGEEHIVDIVTDIRSNTDCTERDSDNLGSVPIFDCRPGPLCGGDAYWCGYDVIIVDFADGSGNIVVNSQFLQNIIMDINDFDDKEIIIIGPSMGGIISKYTLWSMERNSLDHNVRLYISIDAPHQGAYVPLGLQYMAKYYSLVNTDAKDILDVIDTVAAKQMLIYHYSQSGSLDPLDGTDPVSTRLEVDEAAPHSYMQLDDIGYPSQSRNIAISNGNGFGETFGIEGGEILAEKMQDMPQDVTSCNQFPVESCTAYFKIRSLPDEPCCPESDFEIDDGFFGELFGDDVPFGEFFGDDGPFGELFGDDGPFGELFGDKYEDSPQTIFYSVIDVEINYWFDREYYGLVDFKDGEGTPYLDSPCGTTNALQQVPGNNVDSTCFIPTTSALDIDTQDPFLNIHSTENILDMTPFDEIYYPNKNQAHLEITEENLEWMLCEIFDDERWLNFECGRMQESNTRDGLTIQSTFCSDINDCLNKMVATCNRYPSICAEPNFKIIIDDITPILERLPNIDHSITANVEHELESYINNMDDYQFIDHNNFDHNE